MSLGIARGVPRSFPRTILNGGIPFILVSSGTMGNNGALSAITAITGRTVFPIWAYFYFPTGAISAGSAAGWYLGSLLSSTTATIYNNTYSTGQPSIPSSPTAFATTGPGAFTQTTGADITGPNVTIPGGTMGANGSVYWERSINNNNSAGTKTYNTFLGSTTFQGASQTTNPFEGGVGTIRNGGAQNLQTGVNGQHGDVGNAGSLSYGQVDTSASQVFAFSLKIATATDYAVIETYYAQVRPNL